MPGFPDTFRNVREIYGNLIKGFHISRQQLNLYEELQELEEDYQVYFQQLGYKLISDPNGFYYFYHDETAQRSGKTDSMLLFMAVTVDVLSDNGEAPYDKIINDDLSCSELKFLIKEKHDELILQQFENVSCDDFVNKSIGHLETYGFAQVDGDYLNFNTPIYRFLNAIKASEVDV